MTNFMSSGNGFPTPKGDSVEAFKASMGLTSTKNTKSFDKNKEKPSSNLDYVDTNSILDTFALLDVEVNNGTGFSNTIYNNKKEEKQNGLLQLLRNFIN